MVNRKDTTPLPKQRLLLTKEELKAIYKLNKQRAKVMEREVCRYLGASRTLMSGAGSEKGDGFYQNVIVIECKVSSALHRSLGPTIRVQVDWIRKLKKDVDAMRSLGARLGILVLKYHTWREKIICIPVEYLPELEALSGVLIPEAKEIVPLGYSAKGKALVGISISRVLALQLVGSVVATAAGDFYITTIDVLKGWLEQETVT